MSPLECLRCGSTALFKDVPVIDQLDWFKWGRNRDRQAHVEFQLKPEAAVFKEPIHGKLAINMCLDCGHAELRVTNFLEIRASAEMAAEERDGSRGP